MIRKVKEVQTIQHTTRPCIVQARFTQSLKISPKEALEYLKKRIQLHEGEIRTCKEELEEQKANNHVRIKQLRREILVKRVEALCPGKNEFLMRLALKDHHSGNSIFIEKEPRDVNEQATFKICDLTNQLNDLRHVLQNKKRNLNHMLTVFNDTVEDVVFLELEGPMGDSRCLTLENHIGDYGKKFLEAETLQHTYKHIRDQLVVERLTNDTSIETLDNLLKGSEQELSAMQQSLEDSQRRKTQAIANTLRTEVDNHAKRKTRNHKIAHFKRLTEEQRHEFSHLRKAIQAFFAFQESVPLRNAMSDPTHAEMIDLDECSAVRQLRHLEADTLLLREVTGSRCIQGVVECYETQRDTYEHLKSLVKEMEVKKTSQLRKLDTLSVEKNSSVYHDQAPEDTHLKLATEQHRVWESSAAKNNWSSLAATNRVTQALARLRQLLEYLVSSLAHAHLMPPPQRPLSQLETGPYLAEMLQLAGAGVAQLMAQLGPVQPDEELRRAARARFALTRSEEKFTTSKPPALVAALATSTDEGETTGDDVQMASRVVMKQQAHLIVQAKIKAGFGKNKRQL